jgi:vancomycin resistance protein VanJ
MERTLQPIFKFGSLLKVAFTLIVAVYTVALACYLLMRVLFADRFWWLSLANTFAHLLFLPLLFLLPGAILFKLWRRALLLLPLALIGALWFAPYYLPRTAVASDGKTLKVVSFNVWHRNPNLEGVEAWLREVNADVLILQEIPPAYATDHLPNLLDMYPYQAVQPDDTREGNNITLSRYPILSTDYIDLHVQNSPMPLRMVVDVEGQPVALYNIHLAWPVSRPRLRIPRQWSNYYTRVLLGFDDRQRNLQIAGLLDHLKTEPHPYIVGGDFNTSDSTPTYSQMAAQMGDTFREAGVGFGGSWPVSSARGLASFVPPLIRIDYLWHSDQFRAIEAKQGSPLGSDHLALVATLLLIE